MNKKNGKYLMNKHMNGETYIVLSKIYENVISIRGENEDGLIEKSGDDNNPFNQEIGDDLVAMTSPFVPGLHEEKSVNFSCKAEFRGKDDSFYIDVLYKNDDLL